MLAHFRDDSQKHTFARLFDDLIRLGREIRRHLDAERLGGLEVDDELKFSQLHHRQVSGLLALQNPASVDASLAIAMADLGAVAHQAASQRVFTLLIDGRNRVPRRQRDDFVVLAIEERFAAEQHRSGAQLPGCCERGIDVAHIACEQYMYLLTNGSR